MKEITHEEARFIVNNRIVWERPYKNYHDLLDYIIQQETKEERAKKEHELLKLYHKWVFERHFPYDKLRELIDDIKALESELE